MNRFEIKSETRIKAAIFTLFGVNAAKPLGRTRLETDIKRMIVYWWLSKFKWNEYLEYKSQASKFKFLTEGFGFSRGTINHLKKTSWSMYHNDVEFNALFLELDSIINFQAHHQSTPDWIIKLIKHRYTRINGCYIDNPLIIDYLKNEHLRGAVVLEYSKYKSYSYVDCMYGFRLGLTKYMVDEFKKEEHLTARPEPIGDKLTKDQNTRLTKPVKMKSSVFNDNFGGIF